MKKIPLWKKVLGIILTLVALVGVGGTIYLKQSTYPATESAQILSEQAVDSKEYDLYSNGQGNPLSIIFYPGALVAPESYSKWASQVASKGYDVYVVKMPLNLAVFSPNAAEKIIEANPDKSFVMAGHSLGGVMASRFAAYHLDRIRGMIFLASYPDEKGSLTNSGIPVLSITASKDGVLNQEKFQEAKAYLPSQTDYMDIEGGNHAGFGSYGKQKGDIEATISNDMQQEEMSSAIVEWLGRVKE